MGRLVVADAARLMPEDGGSAAQFMPPGTAPYGQVDGRMLRHGLAAEAAKRILPWQSGTACAVIGAMADGWTTGMARDTGRSFRPGDGPGKRGDSRPGGHACPAREPGALAPPSRRRRPGPAARSGGRGSPQARTDGRTSGARARGKAAPVTPGQEKLILAASEAGLTPAAIAREFRLSRAQVEGVLAGARQGRR